MNIEHCPALDVLQRRQFMHPFAIITLVIRILMGGYPAMSEQQALRLVQSCLRQHDVDVGEEPAPGRGKIRHQVSGALEEEYRVTDMRKGMLYAVHLPAHLGNMLLCNHPCRVEMSTGLVGAAS